MMPKNDRKYCSLCSTIIAACQCRCGSVTLPSLGLSRVSYTRRMAIANGTCVSFCNQPKSHYLATSRESRRYVVVYSRFTGAACRYLVTSKESTAHFGLPWVRRWDNCGKCYMDRKRIQCWSNALQHVPIYLQFNRLRAIAR